jgi:hypothetical protein
MTQCGNSAWYRGHASFFAGERREPDILVAGVFGEAPQVRVKGFYGVMPVSGDGRDTHRLRGAARHAAIAQSWQECCG